MADRAEIQQSELHDERFEFWPREMAPGYYDAVEEACHASGFEPDRDEQAAGSTVWGNIAHGRGVGLVVSSLIEQLPHVAYDSWISPPPPRLTISAVWAHRNEHPAIDRLLDITTQLANKQGWI